MVERRRGVIFGRQKNEGNVERFNAGMNDPRCKVKKMETRQMSLSVEPLSTLPQISVSIFIKFKGITLCCIVLWHLPFKAFVILHSVSFYFSFITICIVVESVQISFPSESSEITRNFTMKAKHGRDKGWKWLLFCRAMKSEISCQFREERVSFSARHVINASNRTFDRNV